MNFDFVAQAALSHDFYGALDIRIMARADGATLHICYGVDHIIEDISFETACKLALALRHKERGYLAQDSAA